MPNSFRGRAWVVLFVGVAIRIAFAFAVHGGFIQTLANPDALDYQSFAYNLATGAGFSHSVDQDHPFSQPVVVSAWRAPLYPAFLAVIFQFSRNAMFLMLLQVAMSGVSLYLFLRLGFILFGEWPALIAGLIFAFYPPLILYSADLGSEVPFLVLVLGVLLMFYSAEPTISGSRSFGLGVLVGLATLCRPAGLALVPALAFTFWITTRDWKRAIRCAAVLSLGVAIIVLPWTYRNYRQFHKFILVSSNGGNVLWAGAYMRLIPGASVKEMGYTQSRTDMTEAERDRYYYQQAFVILDHSPIRYLKMFAGNLVAMYTLVPSAANHSARNRIVYSVSYIPLLAFGLVGFWLLRRRWKDLSLLWAFLLTDTLFYCIYISSIRYRVPTVDPLLMIGAGVAMVALISRVWPGTAQNRGA
jgi:4-amino-4-deoxy-L-arabinose transferase-like glycosyltransferase